MPRDSTSPGSHSSGLGFPDQLVISSISGIIDFGMTRTELAAEREPGASRNCPIHRSGASRREAAEIFNVRTWPAMPREKMLWGGGENHCIHRRAAPAGARDRGWHRDRGYVGAGGAGAKHARPTGHSALCWPHGLARRERAREGWFDSVAFLISFSPAFRSRGAK